MSAVRTVVACALLVLPCGRANASPGPQGLTLGVDGGATTLLGDAGAGARVGFTARPYVGYEVGYGLTPLLGISASRWGADLGAWWELAALAGLRWNVLPGRARPWLEATVGYGQLVEEPGRFIDLGLRSEAAAGVSLRVSPRVFASASLAFNRLIARGSVDRASSWLALGVGAGVTWF